MTQGEYWPPGPPPGDAPVAAKGRTRVRSVMVMLLAIAVVVGVGVGRILWPGQGTTHSGLVASSASGAPTAGSSVASSVDPGLVDINTTLDYGQGEAAGTGMVLTSSGEVLTNNHVIAGATSISATDVGNGRTYTATVVGYDLSHDIAVLQLRSASGLRTVTVGESSRTAVGESVVGIGNAGGSGGTPSAAAGSVVALDQSITAVDQSDGTSEQLTGLTQVNADIQPGDSGGPLVNTAGQVIGIDTAASDGYTFQSAGGQGFAVPINEAMVVAHEIEGGHASGAVHLGRTAFLGVEVQAAGQSPFGGLGSAGGPGDAQGGGGSSGAMVSQVVSGSPASTAGLASGDVITAVGGRSVSSPEALTEAMTHFHPGNHVQLRWLDQSGQQQSASVVLTSGPAR